jgi:hypothetical protein
MTRIEKEWRRLERRAAQPGRGEARRSRAALRQFAHDQLRADLGLSTVAWFPIGLPVPEGWRLAPHQIRGQRSHAWSQLVVRDHG